MKAWYCWGAALLVILSTSRSLATEVEGLALSSIREKIKSYIRSQKEQRSEEESKKDEALKIGNNELVSKLAAFINSEAQIEKNVECKPLEPGDSCPQVSTSDEDEGAKIDRNINIAKRGYRTGVKSTNYSRQRDLNYNFKKNYVQKVEDIPDASRLAIDAKHIHESSNEGTSYSTIFCAALRDQHGHIKKFVFHNGDGVMSPDCREKAEELGYDVIKSEQSHAEGEFLQFLFKRSPSDNYTHIIAMGCSRRHCIECDCLFRLILGKNYSEITAAVKPSEYSTVSITNITTDGFRVNKISGYKILQGTAAVSTGKPSPRFFIPVGLKELIKIHTGRPIAELGPKYGGSETQEKQMDMDID